MVYELTLVRYKASKKYVIQSVEAVEYADCISASQQKSNALPVNVLGMTTKLHLMVRLQSHLYIYIVVSWLTKVEGNPKSPFSIASTPSCRRGRYSFPPHTPTLINPPLYTFSSIYTYTQTHIQKEREREREREKIVCVCVCGRRRETGYSEMVSRYTLSFSLLSFFLFLSRQWRII